MEPLNRINAVKVRISVDEVEADGGTEPAKDQDLRIAARYHRAAKSARSEEEVTKGVGVSLDLSAPGAKLGIASLNHETKNTKTRHASLCSYIDGGYVRSLEARRRRRN